METREDKKIGYGVTEDLYEKRESIENNYINSVRDALNDLVEEAKEYPGWETLVISRLNKRNVRKWRTNRFVKHKGNMC